MIEISAVQECARLGAMDSKDRHHYLNQPYGEKPHAPAKPKKRTPRQINDVAYVMGIPTDEITPKVHEALTLIIDEMDSLRWDLEVGRKYVAHLEEEIDHHPILPVASRHALYRELENAANHVKRTGEPSSIIYFRLLNLDHIWRSGGQAACDSALTHASRIILDGVESIDLVAEFDWGAFGVLLNMFDEGEAVEKASHIRGQLRDSPAQWQGNNYPLTISWGVHAIATGEKAAQSLKEAESDLRSRLDLE
ncbi:MAG: diguanylate cyclase [Rhodospirillales bacterium]|jgi:diguanylate cyclase (GGDEF)-like protein|nr:diguanylate cyclase [Rhodospirillales bacterium]